jgi:hypothetical protein
MTSSRTRPILVRIPGRRAQESPRRKCIQSNVDLPVWKKMDIVDAQTKHAGEAVSGKEKVAKDQIKALGLGNYCSVVRI